jgi:Tol biopolymer transport system component
MGRNALIVYLLLLLLLVGCSQTTTNNSATQTVPHQGAWGIYALTLSSEDVELIWSTSEAISFLTINKAGDKFAFSMRTGTNDASSEIFIINVSGTGLTRLTDNNDWDLYPAFSADDSQLAFLRMNTTLDIYKMNADGSNQQLLYDSGSHEADIDWGSNDRIAFTRDSRIWTMNSSGGDVQQVTDPPNAGVWGNANLPFGDYDPKFCRSSNRIAFERLDDDTSVHGNYNLYVVYVPTGATTQLTTNGYSQGLVDWSESATQLVYLVSAINDAGKYDMYIINADGTNNRNITPDYFPDNFLCHMAMFSEDDSKIYFTGQWY